MQRQVWSFLNFYQIAVACKSPVSNETFIHAGLILKNQIDYKTKCKTTILPNSLSVAFLFLLSYFMSL